MKRLTLAVALSMSLFHGGATCFAADAPMPTPFSYTVPAGGFSRTIRIMHVASGTPRLAHMGLHKGGEVIRLELAAWAGDRVQIMINGILTEELPVELSLEAPNPTTTPPVSSAPLSAPPAATISSPLPVAASSEAVSVASAGEPVPAPLPASPTQIVVVPGKPQRIVSGSGVRLRAAPSVSAAEVEKLALGTLVDELEIGSKEEKIGSRSGRWYRIALPDGRDGWIFGAFTIPVSGTDRDTAFMTLASARLVLERQTPNELLELHQLLRSAIGQASSETSRAGLEFWALLALNRYLRETDRSSGSGAPPAAVSAYADELVYSEPAAMYMCKYNLFWDLYEACKGLPQADEMAWKAAHQPIPGETEGFFDLMLAQADETSGRYLRAQPAGAHVGEALKDINEYIFVTAADETFREPSDIPEDELKRRLPDEGRQGALDALARLRTAVESVTHSDRDALLRRLDGLAGRIRDTAK